MPKKPKITNRRLFSLIVAGLCLPVIIGWLSNSGKVSSQNDEPEFAPEIIRFSENFDGVAAPQIPAGWSVSSTGAGATFITTTTSPFSTPNSIYSPAPPTTSSTDLTSPSIYIPSANARLLFRHSYTMENTWDGGVLEISINGGPFQDIIAAGGSFIAGGYSSFLNPSTNPLGSRFAWSGGSAGFIATSVQLPANTFRQQVRFRWRLGTNDSFGFDGWRIDNIEIETINTNFNSTPINIPTSGTASIYSSDIEIFGLNGLVTGIIVDLENFSHTSPDDVDVLLVSPNGRSVVLISDAGGSNPVSNIRLTFDDLAPANSPDNSPLTTNYYRPTNFEPGDNFPAPAPSSAPSGNSLSSFIGSQPNGTWKLFIIDDAPGNGGSLQAGWGISLQTSTSACPFTISPGNASYPITGGSGSFQINIDQGCEWTTSISAAFVSITSGASGIGSGAINYAVAQNLGGGRTATITLSNSLTTRSFQIQQGSGCPFSLNQSALNFSPSGGSGSVAVSAGAICTWQATPSVNWLQVTSATQTGDGTLTFNVLPNTTSAIRTTTLAVGARSLTINQAARATARFDFDGDGKSDISVFRPSDTNWYLLRSNLGFTGIQFGIASDKPAPADYDGDGKTDVAVFRNGTWFLQRSTAGFLQFQFGIAGDIPIPADYNGDGKAEIAVFREGIWYLFDLAANQASAVFFGTAGDKPVAGDYDGDGKADQAVFRNGDWFLNRSTLGFTSLRFGLASDRAIPADYDGDGKDDVAVYRDGNWFIMQSNLGFRAEQFGILSDKPAPADYDGDGKADLGIFRNGEWYLQQSTAGFSARNFGLAGDTAIPGVYFP